MTMNQISEDIYKESAAHLNQKISDILSQITEGRYTSVFLDANMEVRINTPKSCSPGTGEPRHDGADLLCTAYGGR